MAWEDRVKEYVRVKNRADALKELKKFYDRGFRYVVRDLDGEHLVLFSLKPKKYLDLESWGYVNECDPKAIPCQIIRNTDITEINWKNRSAVLIGDFIKKALEQEEE
jgi:hypothetical protein